jgi:hypothetical protein
MAGQMDFTWALALIPFVSAGAGAYFGGYLKTKGENFATHEDIDKLVDQVRAVTTTTKEIEAKISNEVWERQRQWEIKREAVFESMKQLGAFQHHLHDLVLAYEADINAPRGQWHDVKSEAEAKTYAEALGSLAQAKMLAMVVCGPEVRTGFDQLEGLAIRAWNNLKQKDLQAAFTLQDEFILKMYEVARLMRKDLGVDNREY